MKIYIPTDVKQEFSELSGEYNALQTELEQGPNELRRTEILDRIVFINEQFKLGLKSVTGFKES